MANGHLSESFHIHQGTPQGCPLSPLLFLVIIEGFTRSVQSDEGIKATNMLENASKQNILPLGRTASDTAPDQR
eukprot:4870270-Pleurochrysis_carterae.AAC.1